MTVWMETSMVRHQSDVVRRDIRMSSGHPMAVGSEFRVGRVGWVTDILWIAVCYQGGGAFFSAWHQFHPSSGVISRISGIFGVQFSRIVGIYVCWCCYPERKLPPTNIEPRASKRQKKLPTHLAIYQLWSFHFLPYSNCFLLSCFVSLWSSLFTCSF
jgi:hypothetical protein